MSLVDIVRVSDTETDDDDFDLFAGSFGGADLIEGGAGDDEIRAGDDDAMLRGGEGNDNFVLFERGSPENPSNFVNGRPGFDRPCSTACRPTWRRRGSAT